MACKSVSATTSKVSLASTVFTTAEEQLSRCVTQTTVAVSPQDRKAVLDLPLSSQSQDSYPVLSDHLVALHESFSRYERAAGHLPASDSHSTVYSSIPDLADLTMPDAQPPSQNDEVFEEPDLPKLGNRLASVWRKYWLCPHPYCRLIDVLCT